MNMSSFVPLVISLRLTFDGHIFVFANHTRTHRDTIDCHLSWNIPDSFSHTSNASSRTPLIHATLVT